MPLGASLFTVFLCVLFGANAVAIKISLKGLGIFTTAGIRFLLSALAIALWAVATKKPIAVSRKQALQLLPLTLFFTLQLSFFYTGLSKTTASHGTLIANLLPFVVMVLAHFFIPGDRITFRKATGILLGFSGVIFLFYDTSLLDGISFEGDLILLAAVSIWGCNAVYVKRIIADFHPIQVTLYPMMMCAPLCFLFGYLFDIQMVEYVDAEIIASMFYQAFITASFGFVAWNTMLSKFGATALHSFVFIMPVSGVFFGVLLLNEPLTLSLAVSIVMIAGGILVVHLKSWRSIRL